MILFSRFLLQNTGIYGSIPCRALFSNSVRHFKFKGRQTLAPLTLVAKRYAVLGTPLTTGLSPFRQKVIGGWLLGSAGLVFGAVVLGGVTRLTESGLSMVDWKLLKGMKPPLSITDWEAEFEKYKQYPEYQFKVAQAGGRELTLNEFKFIWSMEWGHRMWGRLVGLAIILPAAGFWAAGWLGPPMKKRVLFAGTLVVFQGLLGWYMVKSGLDPANNSEQVPRVSQYRLAAHLTSAFVLYTVLLWSGLSHLMKPVDHNHIKRIGALRGMTHFSKTAIFSTAVIGAFVAGLDAGLVYNSWPKFADRWIPTDLWAKSPAWKNFTENPTMVQFVHRALAYVSLAAVTTTWLMGRRMPLPGRTRKILNATFAMIYVQASLGVLTLLYYVPVWLGSLHQSGSLVTLTLIFWFSNQIRRFPK